MCRDDAASNRSRWCGCGCDYQGSMRSFDACGMCRKEPSSLLNQSGTLPWDSCPLLDPDPLLLSQLCLAAAICFVIMASLVAVNHAFCVARSQSEGLRWLRPRRRFRLTISSRALVQPGAASRKVPPRAKTWMCNVQAAYSSCMGRQFGRLGYWVAMRPWTTLLLSSVLACALATGLSVIKVYEDNLTMWLPQDSPSQIASQDYSSLSGHPRPRNLLILIHAANTTAAAASALPLRSTLEYAIGLHERILELGLSNVTGGSALSQSAASGAFGPLTLWDYSRDKLASDPNPLSTLETAFSSQGTDGGVTTATMKSMISLLKERQNESAAGNDPGVLVALTMAYALNGSTASSIPSVAAFERAVRVALEQNSSSASPVVVRCFSESALSDDLDSAVRNDVLMIMVSMMLMSGYLSFFLGRHCDVLRSRAILAGCAVLSVMLATLSAFGLCAACGAEYNDNANMAIFVLLGVGVDDALIIVRAYESTASSERASASAPSTEAEAENRATAERIGLALSTCGSTILLSSLTNAIAFGLGARSPLPALQGFCTYAAVGMSFDFIFQLTFFVAALALDERRQRLGRSAILCIPVTCFPHVLRPPISTTRQATEADRQVSTSGAKRMDKSVELAASDLSLVTASVADPPPDVAIAAGEKSTGYRPTICLRVARALILLCYIVSLGISVHAARSLKVGLQVSQLVPSSAPARQFLDAQDVLFGHAPTLVEVVVQHSQRAGLPTSAMSSRASMALAGDSNNRSSSQQLGRKRRALGRVAGLEHGSNVSKNAFEALRQLRGALYATGAVHEIVFPAVGHGQRALSPLWIDAFASYLAELGLPSPADMSPDTFDAHFNAFLDTSEGALASSAGGIILQHIDAPDATSSGASRKELLATTWKLLIDGYGPLAMVRLRATLQASGLGSYAFAFSANDVYYEQDAVSTRAMRNHLALVCFAFYPCRPAHMSCIFLPRPSGLVILCARQIMLDYAHQSIVSALAAVLGAVLLLTLRPLFVCLMGVATLSCVAHLLAWMWLVGIRLSSISLVPLLLSVGLCIDFCTHVAHAYGEAAKASHGQQLGTRSRPAHRGRPSTAAGFTIIALQERGFAVLHAGVSTFLSVMLLAFGDSAIFTTFFWMLVGTVVIGLSHALLVLPACLSFLPDEAASAKQPEALHARKAPAPEAASSSWLGHRHGLAESAVPEMEMVEAAAVRL